MRREFAKVVGKRNLDARVQFLSAHHRVVKALQVDDEDAREPENSEFLGHFVDRLALLALESALLHLLRLDEGVKAVLQFDRARDTHSLAREGEAQIHKVVEGVALKAAATLQLVHQLP